MRSRLDEALVGRSIRSVVEIHDYVQLHFNLGIVLNIYNPFQVEGTNDLGLDALVGATTTQVIERVEEVVLRFGTGAVISIDLREAAYTGPEAMLLRVPGGPIIVWRGD